MSRGAPDGNSVGACRKTLKKDRPCATAVPLLGTAFLGRKQDHRLKGHPHPVFTAALFTTAKTRRPLVPTDGWTEEDVARLHGGTVLRRKKEETLPPVTAWVDLEGTVLREGSHTEKATCRVTSPTHGP